jgi:hypothetical protein
VVGEPAREIGLRPDAEVDGRFASSRSERAVEAPFLSERLSATSGD